MLKYTKESFSLNIQTNNITWDLWRYVAGILQLVLGWSRKNKTNDEDDNDDDWSRWHADAEDNWDNFPCWCFNIYFVLLFVTFLWIKVKKTTVLWNVLNTCKISEAARGGAERRGGARHENRFMSDFSSPLSANRRLFLHKILVWIRSFYFWKESQTLLSFNALFL